jgi:hypothetical protein
VYPLTVRIGDTETISLTITDSAGPINITGRTYAAQIRAFPSSSTIVAAFTCAIVNAAAGTVACTLSATTTAALAPQTAAFDLQETNGAVVTTLLAGQVSIVQDVTR